jgi:hypothetical protein
MLSRLIRPRLGAALVFSALTALLIVPSAAAQYYPPPPPPPPQPTPSSGSQSTGTTSGSGVVRVENGPNVRGAAGNITFTGVAVDCASGQPADRVAVNDGAGGPNIAYVSMDTTKSYAEYCSGRAGSAKIGWTLIYDSRRLNNGSHTFEFKAEFPGGGTASTTVPVFVDNFSGSADGGYYGFYDYYARSPYYGGGYYGGGYYGGYPGYYGGVSGYGYYPYQQSISFPYYNYPNNIYPYTYQYYNQYSPYYNQYYNQYNQYYNNPYYYYNPYYRY